MSDLAFRRATERDLPFIFDSWIESFREAHAAGPIPMPRYRAVYREVVTWILDRSGVETWVAYNPHDDDQVFGFICHELGVIDRRTGRETPAVHYLFIKQPFRRLGLARRLFKMAGVDPKRPFLYSFKTATGADLIRSLRLAGIWNPLFARFAKQTQRKVTDED